jgi:hypothetical protein
MTTFTFVHVVLSLVGIGSGFVILWGLLTARRLEGWTALFLASNVATSATGFLFPFERLLPSHVLGTLSLVVLTAAIVARYPRRLGGVWRRVYAVTAVTALYFNVFVLIVQLFLKVPALHELAPTQSEAPFAITQLVALVLFALFAAGAAIKFRPEPVEAARVQ